MLHRIVDGIGNLALQISLDPTALARTAQALDVAADVGAAAGFLSGKIEGDVTLGRSHHAQKLALRLMLVAAEALPHGDLFYSLLLLHDGISRP